ncbi:PREDICTED: wall-associated receptor kinase-like 8, partial [Theobroma cacao]|uniref:Wall-associated receptor kinase-like 8 n=1 Tax=Theobroma cacao TaxID=3641 RepID=A0AB32WFF4_THECC
ISAAPCKFPFSNSFCHFWTLFLRSWFQQLYFHLRFDQLNICRLKIAVGIANAVAYLHTAFSRPVIHRSIHCSSIVLDQNNVPKLIDFGLCISIPEGQSHVKDAIRGRAEWVSPEYWDRGHLTEKADVYLFGKLLIELLTGQQAVHFMMEHDITDIGKVSAEKLSNSVDSRIKNEGIDLEQLLDFATLSLRCISFEEEKRPTMIEVGKELRQIDQACPLPC